MGNSTSVFDRTYGIFRIHCFHKHQKQTCQDYEISYLVQCDKWQQGLERQGQMQFQQRNIQCPSVFQPHVTYSPVTSADKMSSIMLIYLLTVFVVYKF